MATEEIVLNVKSDIGDVTKDTEKLVKSTSGAKKGFKGLGTAIKGVGMAFKAAGIGLIIAVFAALKEAVERNQTAMDGINTVMSTVSTTFNQVVSVLSDVVSWVTQSSDRFDGLGKVLGGLITMALAPLKLAFYGLKLGVQQVMLAWEDSFLGGGDAGKIATLRADIVGTKDDILKVAEATVAAGKDIYNNLGDAVGEIGAIYEKAAEGISKISVKANYEQAKATTAATGAALFAAAEFAKLNAEKLKEAELFRQIRDDETKTFAERIQANKDLKKSLEEQQKLQREQVQIGIRAAALLVEQNGNDENKLALMEAQNAELELEETITGQLSEQKTNQVGLEKELAEVRNEIRAEGLEGLARELEELQITYDAKIEMARKAGEDTAKITKKYEKDITKIKKTEAQKQIDLDKFVEQSKMDTIAMGLQVAGSLAKEGSAAAKGIAVANTIFNTQQSIMKAMADVPYPYNIVQSAMNGIMGAVAVSKILSTDPSGAGGGGGGATATAAPPAPQMMSGAFDISGGVEPEATKAYVVTDEMSNSQNQLANIRRRATI